MHLTMKRHFLRAQNLRLPYFCLLFGALLTIVFMGLNHIEVDSRSISSIWDIIQNSCSERREAHSPSQHAPTDQFSETNQTQTLPDTRKSTIDTCNGCRKLINKVLGNYSLKWTKSEKNHQELRSLLINNCNGFQKAFVTQVNSPLGTKITYDGEKRVRTVDKDLFNSIPKDIHFSNKVLDTCAVVGNGGILVNSSCGAAIDSAQFVIRCNLPLLDKGFWKHVGKKTNIVTSNPSIINKKYGSLRGRRRQFVDDISVYSESLLFLPAFSYAFCTGLSMSALYTLEDFRSSVRTVFLNPDYLKKLDTFWRSQKLNPHLRLSSGFMMVSLALEICNNVDVFGFWPFEYHPYNYQPCTNHYYDDEKASRLHAMPAEFAYLMQLHNQGVLKLHLGACPPH